MTEAPIRDPQNEAPAFLWPGAEGRPQNEMVFVGVFVPDLNLTFASGRGVKMGPTSWKSTEGPYQDKTRSFGEMNMIFIRSVGRMCLVLAASD